MFNLLVGKICTAIPSSLKLTGDNSMKIDRNKQIPNTTVYFALYTIIFGISIWLLTFHKESANDWFLYLAMIGSVLAGLIKFGLQSRNRNQQSV
jgi:uncharacterized membrane protein YoaK (UPF0700 family)